MLSQHDIDYYRSLRRDPPRNEPRVEIEFEVRANNTNVPGHDRLFKRGTHTAVVYKSDFERMKRDQLETDTDQLASAELRHEQNLAEYVAEKTKGCDSADRDRLEAEARRTYVGSVEAEFHLMMRRGIKPIASIKKLRDLDPPEDERSEWLRRAVQGISGGGDGDSAIAKQIEKLASDMADLRKENRDLRSKLEKAAGKS